MGPTAYAGSNSYSARVQCVGFVVAIDDVSVSEVNGMEGGGEMMTGKGRGRFQDMLWDCVQCPKETAVKILGSRLSQR